MSAWDFKVDTVRGLKEEGPKKKRENVFQNSDSVVHNHNSTEVAPPLACADDDSPERELWPSEGSAPPTRLSNGIPGSHHDDDEEQSLLDQRASGGKQNGHLSYPSPPEDEGGLEENREEVEAELKEKERKERKEEEVVEEGEEEEEVVMVKDSSPHLSMNSFPGDIGVVPAHNELELYEKVVTDEELSSTGEEDTQLSSEFIEPPCLPVPPPSKSLSLYSIVHPVLDRVSVGIPVSVFG